MLLVGWDAADWKVAGPLIDAGALPVLSGVVDRGTVADMATLEPVLSPLLWNSIATGKRADRHGILGFTEIDPVTGRVRPVTSTSRRTKAIWNILSQRGFRTNVAGWFAGHPAEPIRGVCVSDAFTRGFPPLGKPWPRVAGTVYPDSLAPVLENLRLRPEEIDEEILRLFVPKLDAIDRDKPNALSSLAKILAECFSIHAAATWLMENTEWDFMAVYYIGIDHFSHLFMNFHPPRPEWVAESDFEIYRDVIAGAYRLMDLFLGRLLQLAGPDPTVLVLSDHGFHSDHLRPRDIPRTPAGPAIQHRSLGMFVAAGPGIRKDERIYGVNLLDVAPTVLSLFRLPAGLDMPGRVLNEMFDRAPELDRIPSWDGVEGDSGMHPQGTRAETTDGETEAAERLLLEQFVALGYIDPQPDDHKLAARNCERERNWNLARVYTGSGRFEEALPLLEVLHAESPERPEFALALADSQLRTGLLDEAEAGATRVLSQRTDAPAAHYVLSRIALRRGLVRDSLRHLRQAEESDRPSAELRTRIGLVYMKLRLWAEAESALRSALAMDPHKALAHQGLARLHYRRGEFDSAARKALDSIGCRHDFAVSHFILGLAMRRLGDRERAIQALEASLSFNPPLRIAHRVLAAMYGDTADGDRHREAARRYRAGLEQARLRMDALHKDARKRALDRTARAAGAEVAPLTVRSLDFLIVSGLPRSGTSLAMQMLRAAGLNPMTDGQRVPDEDNPEGYLEWEAIKRVASQPEILLEAEGRPVKVVSMLLSALPSCHRYKVIFMDRPIRQIAESQWKMIARRKSEKPAASREHIERLLADHREETLAGLRNTPGFELLVVDYPELVRSPEEWIPRIVEFIGAVPRPEAMSGVVRPELHRNRYADEA